MSWCKPSITTCVMFWRVRATLQDCPASGHEAGHGGWRQTWWAAWFCLLGRAGAFCESSQGLSVCETLTSPFSEGTC